jgi:hypothetical protein
VSLLTAVELIKAKLPDAPDAKFVVEHALSGVSTK